MTRGVFVRSFLGAFVLSSVALGVLGYAASQWFVEQPKERFLTPYMEMTMAEGWKCQWEGTEGVCRKHMEGKKRDRAAVAIFTAKYRGLIDAFACYEQELRRPRTLEGRDGLQPVQSKLEHLKMRKIGTYTWMDGLVFQSEISNYYTQYLATMTSRIAILVTFSVHHKHLDAHLSDVESMIDKIRIYEHGGTAPYTVGDVGNLCGGTPIVDGYAEALDTAPETDRARP